MAINITPANGKLELTQTNVRLGKLNPGIATDEAVVMSQYNSLDSRIIAIETGTDDLTEVKVTDGSATAPSFTFVNDEDTGLYRIGANNLGIAAGGTKIVDITTAGISVVGTFSASTTVSAGTLLLTGNGAVGAPSHSFTSDADTGMYSIGANNIGIAAGGTKIIDITTSGTAITGTLSATTTVTAGTLLISGDGAVGAPAHTFTNDLDSGLYWIGANNIGFAAGGNKVLDIGTAGLGVTGSLSTTTYFLTGDGAVGAPAHSFVSDTDTGLYRIGANNTGFACGGTKILDIATTGLAVTGTISATTTVTATTLFFSGDGAVGAPTYSFVSDTDSGVYRIGADNIGIACNGAKVLDIATTGLTITGATSTTTTLNVGTNQTFNKESNHTILVSASTTANTSGGNLTVNSGDGVGTGDGGTLLLSAGNGGAGATGNGGGVSINGANSASTDGDGGNVVITAGTKTGSGIDAQVILRSAASTPVLIKRSVAGTGGDTVTLTVAQLFNGIFNQTSTAATTCTTPTGNQISAALGASLAVGDSFDFCLINTGGTGDNITFTAGVNVSVVGHAIVYPAADVGTAGAASGTFRFVNSAANTWIAYRIA